MANNVYVGVLLPLKVDSFFIYTVPDNLIEKIDIGKRVLVQFGKRKIYTGIIASILTETSISEVKQILEVLDSKPIVTKEQLLFCEWVARYYLCPLGEVINTMLPSNLKLESSTKISKGENFDNFSPESKQEEILFEILNKKGFILIEKFIEIIKKKNIKPLINKLLNNKYIALEETVINKYNPKYVDYVFVNKIPESEEEVNEWFKKIEKAPKQTNVLLAFFALNKGQWKNLKPVKKQELLKKANDNGSALKILIKKNILKILKLQENIINTDVNNNKTTINVLTPTQEKVKENILEAFKNKTVVLLHGVTASGKTDIYIKIIEEYIKKGKQILYLLPEIALTSQIVKRLKNSLAGKLLVYHSKISDTERTETYFYMINNPNLPIVVIGVRSSIFLPFTNLGLIIVDEEHEITYKQQTSEPYYNARDAAIVLAGLFKANVLLGSATPSIESYYNALTNKYQLVELTTRYNNVELPEIEIINLREERKKKRVSLNCYSQKLIEQLKRNIENNKQSIVFQNRRGYSPYIECEHCGWIPECTKCDVKLTYHKSYGKLICHYCGYSISVPSTCQSCSLPELKIRGLGTERIEDELSSLIPDVKIVRMDLDTTRTKNKIENILSSVEKNQINILVGTQMVTKGLDFENVELIAIVDADSIMNYPDFRTNERSFQLFTQVAGRAGRRNKQGKVIIQTSQVNHPVIKFLQKNDYKGFVMWQLEERKRFHYPPFTRLIKIRILHYSFEWISKVSNNLSEILKKEKEIIVIGPQSPIVSKIKNKYIIDIWLKLGKMYNNLSYRDKLYSIINDFFNKPEYKNLKWHIDVDPY